MLRGSEKYQTQVLMLIGGALLLCVVLAVTAVVVNPFGGRPSDQISVAITTPYVGQGIEPGSAVVLYGVEVGKVTNVALSPRGGVRLSADLEKRPVQGLTDSMNIDYRPINYFGVPGVNIIPTPGGRGIHDGTEINLVPKGNFTLSELLSQLGAVSASALTHRLVTVVDRVTRYTDGFNPLFETMLIVTKTVADVQRVSTAHLLTNTASIGDAIPAFINPLIIAPARLADYQYYPEHTSATPPPGTPINKATGQKLTAPYMEYTNIKSLGDETADIFDHLFQPYFELASGGLFAAVGKVAGSHVDDLFPLVAGVKSLTDAVPPLLRPGDIAKTLAELRSRFERLYGGNGDQRALRVRLLLDSLPGVAAPLGFQQVPPSPAPAGSPPGAAAATAVGGRSGR